MFKNETKETLSMIAEKMSSPETSAIESRNINNAIKEEVLANQINNLFELNKKKDGSDLLFSTNQFFPYSIPYDIILPEDYVLSPSGTYLILKDEDSADIKLLCISKTPFFIAQKTEQGKVLLVRYVNNTWLRDWLPVKTVISKNTLLTATIFPQKNIKMKSLTDYAMACATIAPFVTIPDKAFIALLQTITEKHFLFLEATFPVLVNVASVKEICTDYEIPYNDLRNWLAQRDIINHQSDIARDKQTKKPTRFLVFKSPLSEYIESDFSETNEKSVYNVSISSENDVFSP